MRSTYAQNSVKSGHFLLALLAGIIALPAFAGPGTTCVVTNLRRGAPDEWTVKTARGRTVDFSVGR